MKSLYQAAAFYLFFSGLCFCGTANVRAQSIARTTLFKKQSLNELRNQDPGPGENSFQTITLTPVYHNPLIPDNSIEQQNRSILAKQGMLPGQSRNEEPSNELGREIKQDALKQKKTRLLAAQKSFQDSFQGFLTLDPDNFSITKAIYLCESAWYDQPPSFDEFEKAIRSRADLAKLILKKEGLNARDNIALNYAIQKLYTTDNRFIDQRTKRMVTIPKLGYDFEDFMGEKNWSNMFVTKLLFFGKGQCHSLPLLYLAMAEHLGAKAYLSLSPEHSFIQFFDKNGYRYNFETTNGNLVTHTWLMQSTFINATALKNRTYLDTLSPKQLYAQLLSDLLQNYTNKLGHDETTMQITERILAIDPDNVAARMTQANYNTFVVREQLKKAGYPSMDQIANYPEVNRAYQNMLKSYELIEQTGFQEMPKEDYQRWLKTVEQEKEKQKNLEIQQQLKKKIEKVRK
jgi:hypothetical protein